MTQMWGPGLDAEVEYRRDKLTHVAARARSARRRVRRAAAAAPVTVAATPDGTAPALAGSAVPEPAVVEHAVAGPTGSRAA